MLPRVTSVRGVAGAIPARRPRRGLKHHVPKSRDPHARKTSVFLITLNTNQPYFNDARGRADYQGFHDAVMDATEELFNVDDEDEWKRTIKFLNPADIGHYDLIESIHFSARAEVGPVYRRIHAHVFVRITHRSKIHLDPAFLKSYYKRAGRIQENNLLANLAYLNIRAGSYKALEHYVDEYFKDSEMEPVRTLGERVEDEAGPPDDD